MSFFSSLRARLIFLAFLVVLPVLGLTLFQFVEARNAAIDQVQEDALRLTRSVVYVQENLTEDAHRLLLEMAEFSGVRAANSFRCRTAFAALLRYNPAYINLAATDASGEIFCSALPLPASVNVADMPFFQRAVESRDFSVGDYQFSHSTNTSILTYSYPVLDETGQLITVVFASLDLDWLSQLIADVTQPSDAVFTIFDQEGTILTRYPDPQLWMGQTSPDAQPIIAVITDQEQGTTEITGDDGIRRLYAFSSFQPTSASNRVNITISIPVEYAFAETNNSLVRNLIGLSVVMALALGIAWVGTDLLILRQINALLYATRQLSKGNLTTRTTLSYGSSEMSQLARAFDDMAAALQQREIERQQAEESLRDSQSFLEKAQEVAKIGSWVSSLDMQHGKVIWSKEIYRIYGVDDQQFGGRAATFFTLIHPDDRDGVQAAIQASLADNIPYNIEHRIIRPDGTIRWIHEQAEIIRDEKDEPVKMVGIVQDITEQKQTQEVLHRHTDELEQRVTERTAELHAALEQEKGLNDLKLQFASMVSHEFRTPLAAIRLSADVLKKFHDRLTDEKRIEHLDKIQSRVKVLVEMLDQLLTISRADSVGLEFNPVSLNMEDLCRSFIEEVLHSVGGTRQIIFTANSGCFEPRGDEKLLQHIITNLLSNALKYSPEGGPVHFNLSCDETQIIVQIKDQGIGIPEADLENLFQIFHRAQNVTGIPGTGLGLALALRAAEAHGGSISVESEEGVGSTFTVHLPQTQM